MSQIGCLSDDADDFVVLIASRGTISVYDVIDVMIDDDGNSRAVRCGCA